MFSVCLFSFSYDATYKKQKELNTRFRMFAKNVAKAYGGPNIVETQLPNHDWTAALAMQQYCESADSDEVGWIPCETCA